MKQLIINTGWQVQRLVFVDDLKAEAAYKTLKEGMENFERFRNDKEKTVSFAEDWGEATFNLEHLYSVCLEDMSEAADKVFAETAVRNARIDSLVKEQKALAAASANTFSNEPTVRVE